MNKAPRKAGARRRQVSNQRPPSTPNRSSQRAPAAAGNRTKAKASSRPSPKPKPNNSARAKRRSGGCGQFLYDFVAAVLILSILAYFFLPMDRYIARADARRHHYSSREYDDTSQRYYYTKLSSNAKLAYRIIVSALPDFPEQICVPEIDDEELNEVFKAVSYDNPELFMLGTECTLTRVGKSFWFVPQYTMKKATYDKQLSKAEDVATEILSHVPKGASEYETELFLHDALGVMSEYSSKDGDVYTPYGMLVKREANCEGYSRSFQWLLQRAGIENRVITGKATSADGTENHMWNVVKLDGQEYTVDVTWDDYRVTGAHESLETAMMEPSHIYFNRSAEAMSGNHTPEEESLWEKCTDDSQNYFLVNDLQITDKTTETALRKSIIDGTVNARVAGNSSLEIYFTSKDAYRKADAMLIGGSGVYDLLEAANRSLPTARRVNSSAIQYSMDDDLLTIRLFFL